MNFDFDRLIDRRSSGSIKWHKYPADVLPLWVADMDFAVPEPIRAALHASVDHGIFGYEIPTPQLLETVAERMHRLYGWRVEPDWIVTTPGVVSAFFSAARAFCDGSGILVQPPVYPPFLSVAKDTGAVQQLAPLQRLEQGSTVFYEIDWSAFEAGFGSAGARTAMFLLCSPHNPTGQAYPKDALLRMAESCLKHGALLCSDEIHSELLLGGTKHIPIASLDPEIARRSLTLVAPSKTFNVPGLYCAFAILPDPELRARYETTVEHLNSGLGMVAAQAAFSGQCDDWLEALRSYLTGNRDFLVRFVEQELPGVRTTVPDATYLAWLDCSDLVASGRLSSPPSEFFLKNAGVALNNGADFGLGGENFVRLNFGCPRAILVEALGKMKKALGV
ncbi:MAG TPA: MalY/PatB family protein [Anaerolineales bacterium]|nr:MalY/PatB family protein [Anaerolineales bacterium]